MNFFTRNTFVSLLCFFVAVSVTNAQPGCPAVDAGSNVQLPCGTNCTTLTATPFPSGNTTSYSVGAIPYTPFSYTAGTPILVNIDDIWSSAINLPFTFCFFGNSYTQVVVGANGLITFDVSQANLGCVWDLTSAGTMPTANIYGNSIMGPYHDIDPSLGGNISYQILGTAPCRIFVISYNQVPMYNSDNFLSTCSGMDATHQIAIYETTNAIEIYIAHKDACPDGGFLQTGWNDGLAVEGIQNATQTVAYTVPGRNNSVWTANNDAWRFTPNGPSIVSVAWFQGANQIATGNSVQVCPPTATTYTAQATYLPCSGGTPVVVTDDVTVSLAGSLQSSITSSQNISCFGATDGSATATVSGGTPPITYGWSNGAGTLSITGLSAGTYVFTATDAASCTRSDTVRITQPTQLVTNVTDVTQTNCSGTGTGTLTATASGGTYGYSYSWNSSPVQTDSILNNVAAGTYTITVTDSKGCTATSSGTLTIQTGGNTVALGTPVITDVACFGGANGDITASASGGSGTFNYNWSGGATGATLSNLAAGSYSVTADDGAGCSVSATYTVAEPTQLVIGQPTIQNIGCGSNNTGSIAATASGGTVPYTYSWAQQSNSQTYSGSSISGLVADTYALTVTDDNGCTATDTYQITQVAALTFSQSFTNVSCMGGNDGSATITVNTGTAPYQYNWNGTGNSSNATINGLSSGSVTVTVSDANCSATASFTLTEPTAVTINLINQDNVSCGNSADGSLTVAASGGTPGPAGSGYTYLWNTTETTPAISGLSANTYTVTVTDGNGCTATEAYTIIQPSSVNLSVTATDAVCYQAPNGSASVVASGGTTPYQYIWSDGQTDATASALVAGQYFCTVSDANGCSASTTTLVNDPPEMQINTTGNAVKCPGDKNGSIDVSATGGTMPYNYSATQDGANFVFATDGTIQNLAPGDYTVIVSDNNGCTKIDLVTVPDATPDNFITVTDSTSCFGVDYIDGATHIVATSIQNGPYQFGIDGGSLQYSGDFYGLSSGEHHLTAVNGKGCTSDVVVTVYQPLPVLASVIPDSLILPLGEGDKVLVTYQNASDVSYSWTPTTGLSCMDCPDPFVTVYHRGDYTVTVTMQNGTSTCFGKANLHVEVLPELPVYVPNSFSPNGDGNNDIFQVYGQGIETVDLKIFNRWGELVYQSNNQFAGWDGTYKGQLQLPQVFTYVANITFLNNKKSEKKGTITLIR